MIVVNLFGGPGSGKSTMATRVFSELKEQGYNAELVTEYAKELVWADSLKTLGNQIYVFGKQHQRLWRLKDSVDIVVTDSPLLFSLVYGSTSVPFKMMVREEFVKFNNLNIVLNRVKEYNPKGRTQTLDEAKLIDKRIDEMLEFNMIKPQLRIDGKKDSTEIIVKLIKERYVNTNPA